MKSRYIENSELTKLKRSLKKAWLPFEVAEVTGLRIGDVLKIKVNDIDLEKKELNYVSQKCSKRGSCFLPAELATRLLKNSHGREYCFPSRSKKGHLTRQAAWKRIKKAAERCGIDKDGVSPHALRKVFAVELYKKKGINAVKEALQHSRSDTTQIYALADFTTGKSANVPLLRGDLQMITELIVQQLKSMRFD